MGQVNDVRPRCVKRTSDGDNGHDINNHPDHHDDCLGIHSDGDHLGTSDVGSRCDEYAEHGTRHNEGVDNVILNNRAAHNNNNDGAAHYNDYDHHNHFNHHNNDHNNDNSAAHHLFGDLQRQYEWRWGSAYGWHRIREWRDGDCGRQHRVVDEGGIQL